MAWQWKPKYPMKWNHNIIKVKDPEEIKAPNCLC